MAHLVLIFPFQEHGRLGQMVYPTISILTSGALVAAILLAADWYVWGLTYANDFRQPHPVKPQGAGNVMESVLARFVATAEVSLPRTEPTLSSPMATSTTSQDDGHGFKQVA
jgi:hypothetical protein